MVPADPTTTSERPGQAVAGFIDAPQSPPLAALHAYWRGKCAGRAMPARRDIDPAEIKPVLPYVILYDADSASDYRIRLVGEAIVDFVGRNLTGQGAAASMDPKPAEMMRLILRMVAETGRPIFRAGKAWWLRDRSYRDFEACFLPLSPDGCTVNIILGGITFDTAEAVAPSGA